MKSEKNLHFSLLLAHYEDIEKKAIELRRSTKLKLPDSIVAATSIVLDAILLTDDEHLLSLSLPGLKTQSIL